METSTSKQDELDHSSLSDSDDTYSWHCGCPCDPYPDDMFQGHGPPDPNYEDDADMKKEEGVKKHTCKKTTNVSKKKKPTKKIKKQKEKPKVHKEDIDDAIDNAIDNDIENN